MKGLGATAFRFSFEVCILSLSAVRGGFSSLHASQCACHPPLHTARYSMMPVPHTLSQWARFEPQGPGSIEPEAIARYHQILDCCQEHSLTPCATLHHFTHPQWFEDRGGFAVVRFNRRTVVLQGRRVHGDECRSDSQCSALLCSALWPVLPITLTYCSLHRNPTSLCSSTTAPWSSSTLGHASRCGPPSMSPL